MTTINGYEVHFINLPNRLLVEYYSTSTGWDLKYYSKNTSFRTVKKFIKSL